MTDERKLASVRRIKQLLPIEGADKIELAIVDDWQVVTLKGIHKVGDPVAYFEIDSFVPASNPAFASFEERFTTYKGQRGMRVKTIKLRKQISQGIILPLSAFSEFDGGNRPKPLDGADLTDLLKIVKYDQYESDEPGAEKERKFPSFITKTKQERIQNCSRRVNQAIADGEVFERTAKMDGSSMTAYMVRHDSKHYPEALKLQRVNMSAFERFYQNIKDLVNKYIFKKKPDDIFAVCSHNVQLPEDNSAFWQVARELSLKEILDAFGGSNALQGELIGPGIRGNPEGLKKKEFRLFDIFNIDEGKYSLLNERYNSVREFDIPHVPILSIGRLTDIPGVAEDTVSGLLKAAEGKNGSGKEREGDVYKSTTRDFSFKVMSNKFLLTEE